jgi:hypothetical protein
MAGLFILVILIADFAVYTSPGSYAYAFLAGKCSHDPMPSICHTMARRPNSGSAPYRSAWYWRAF